MRLYIDCDMTLVLWQDGLEHPYEGAEKYIRNQPLIDAIHRFAAANPDVGVTVWSFGGMSYARHWAERFGLPTDGVMAKDIRTPQPNDIVVDDMPLKVNARLMLPDQFVHHVNNTVSEVEVEPNHKWSRAKQDDAIKFVDRFSEIDGVRTEEI